MARRLRGASRGQAMVEFAVAIPIFLLLVFAVIDGGRLIFTLSTATHAVNEGARLAALPTTADEQTVKGAVVDAAVALAVRVSDVEVSVTGANVTYAAREAADRVRVTLRHEFRPVLFALFGDQVITLTPTAEFMVEGAP